MFRCGGVSLGGRVIVLARICSFVLSSHGFVDAPFLFLSFLLCGGLSFRVLIFCCAVDVFLSGGWSFALVLRSFLGCVVAVRDCRAAVALFSFVGWSFALVLWSFVWLVGHLLWCGALLLGALVICFAVVIVHLVGWSFALVRRSFSWWFGNLICE